MPSERKDHYATLGLSKDADIATVRKQYKKLALRYHPDRTTGSTEEFQKIQDAFDILGKAESKSKYDATLANGILNGTYLCPVCNDCPGRLDLNDIWAHIDEVHRGAKCTSCTDFSPETYKTLRTHLWNDHRWVLSLVGLPPRGNLL
ncbi:dnaJ domain-containing protein [Purpureocillium lilacinum]|uniref:DnaJ domain-containing protein n=1 Tax=Purpureocillium lilacinum TaxID=33203 RepID=A0A179GB91_PURLI|nr:dnaJ domain-containing protein [Purpureocillium lilacinum]